LAEQLARHLEEQQLKVCFLHSDLKTPARTQLLQQLRLGEFDCLVGVNLLREGLDLPEVALVAIMDADIESYLRDQRSLIQTIGRAARNTESRVILFADTITKSMKAAIDETARRRTLQQAYNAQHGITPVTVTRDVTKSIVNIQDAIAKASARKRSKKSSELEVDTAATSKKSSTAQRIKALEIAMREAAQAQDFETAIQLRNQLLALQVKDGMRQ
jgi:excinuclease ABC subunit B